MQLEPLPYHVAVADALERAEPELWRWFRSDAYSKAYKNETDKDLLRQAIRLERATDKSGPNERRYALAEKARDALGLTEPITLFQMQDQAGAPNAFLVFTPGMIMIAFSGRILELLVTDAELLDLLGHEISHYKLCTSTDGRFHTADRLLLWLIQRDNCPPEFFETWRRNKLYTEIYCDIGGLVACGDHEATIRGLVKAIADFKDADAASYLRQAQELLARDPGASRGTTHPELHVRVIAVANADKPPAELDALLQPLIAGKIEIGGLDLVDQQRLRELTRSVLDRVLGEKGAANDEAIAYARQMFADYEQPAGPAQPLPKATVGPKATAGSKATVGLAASAIDYLAYLLLDLGAMEGSGSKALMAIATEAAGELGLGARFREIARVELKGRRSLLAGLISRAA